MADVVGYSRLMGENESATLQTLTTYQKIMDGLIRQNRGRVVDSPGDALLAEFSSVVDAVQCAVAVQKELQARNAELPENRRMQFRIGINLGDVIEEGKKIYGDGVNIAARLEALAEPGGICISKTAFDHIETKLPLGYEFLGEKTVKNIARPVSAYRVLLEPRVTAARKIDKEKTQRGWHMKIVVAAGLVMLVAAISLAAWKSGFFSRPEKQAAPPSAQPSLSSPTPAAPSPQISLPPQAVSPTPLVPSPGEAPSTLAAPPIRDAAISFFKNLDTNNDGKVTLSEFMAWREARFDFLDANKDGSLSRSEVSAGKIKFARLLRKNFALIDANQDQMLSREEFREATRLIFFRMDTNRDGHLTKNELIEARARQE
jgi:adenylate cyclase